VYQSPPDLYGKKRWTNPHNNLKDWRGKKMTFSFFLSFPPHFVNKQFYSKITLPRKSKTISVHR
jgi:hypothetical protein